MRCPEGSNFKNGRVYDVLFNKPYVNVISPSPVYIKRENDVIEYYSEILTQLNGMTIPVKFLGMGLFEIDITCVIRDRKLNDLLC